MITFSTIFLCLIISWFIYKNLPSKTKIKIISCDSKFNTMVKNHIFSGDLAHFKPSFMLFPALAQSLLFSAIKWTELISKFDREYLKSPDGGQICLDWARPESSKELKNSIIFILHGLAGSSKSRYIQEVVKPALEEGYTVVIMNQRGINQELITPKPYDLTDFSDVTIAINHVNMLYPGWQLYGIGFSMGGNQLLRYCGKMGEKALFKGLIALSAPFNLSASFEKFENTFYETFMIRNYKNCYINPHQRFFPDFEKIYGVDMKEIQALNSLREFNNKFSCKIFSAKNSDDYLSGCKITEEEIKSISIPTLIIHAKDDPLCPSGQVPIDLLKQNPSIIYSETQYGAHVCWFTGFNFSRVKTN